MTHDRDIERILGQWLGDGSIEAPDRVIDVVADRIEHQSQRPAWRLQWRQPHVISYLRLSAVVAAIVIVVIAGINLAGSSSSSGVGGATPQPSSTPTESQTPVESLDPVSSVTFRPSVHLLVPRGWAVESDSARAFVLNAPAGPSGAAAGSIQVMSGPFVAAADPDCEGRAAAGVGGAAAEVVVTLADDPRLSSRSAGRVRLFDQSGDALDLEIAPGWTGTCAWGQGKPAAVLLMATAEGPAFGLAGSERSRLIVVDVGSTVVSIIVSAETGSAQQTFLAQAMPIVANINFAP
jgi:hypothetical protein